MTTRPTSPDHAPRDFDNVDDLEDIAVLTEHSSQSGADQLWDLPVSVWPCAQQVSRAQRAHRYVPESNAHPGKMLPAIARHAITTYTAPGDTVADPMCGIGTTLVEALHLGRHALGVEYEHRWITTTAANLALAQRQGATGTALAVQGDARHAVTALGDSHLGNVALLLTSPPYGASVHGRAHVTPGRGVHKTNHVYGSDRANLAHRSLPSLLRGFTDILRGCIPLLRPGGVVAITTRPFRSGGELIDFPSLTLDAAIAAGLEPVQRCVALLAGLRDGRLIPRSSFFQLDYIRKAREHGVPAWVIAHEDVLILRAPQPSGVPAKRCDVNTPVPTTQGGPGRSPVPAQPATSRR